MNRISTKRMAVLAAGSLLAGSTLYAGTIEMHVEAPVVGLAASGIHNLRGWAVSTAGIDHVELYVDGSYRFDIPMGGKRGDVANQFPGNLYPGSEASGFSMAYNYALLADGAHSMTIRVVDNDQQDLARTVDFVVIGSTVGYVSDLSQFDLSQAVATGAGNTITIENARINGVAYDLELTWRTEAQQFQLSAITPI